MENFTYGYDVEGYIAEALKKIQVCLPWATRDMFRPECSYAIEDDGSKKVFVRYFRWSDGSTDRYVYENENEFIDKIIEDNEWWIEGENPIKETFSLPVHGQDISGWNLERYEFRKHVLGGFSSMIQAGNRYTGGNREFFLPDSFFDGSFEDFVEHYNDFVPGPFRIDPDFLETVPGLKTFLGFNE